MQIETSTVVGQIVVQGELPPARPVGTVLARERSESFEVPAELEADLSVSPWRAAEKPPLRKIIYSVACVASL